MGKRLIERGMHSTWGSMQKVDLNGESWKVYHNWSDSVENKGCCKVKKGALSDVANMSKNEIGTS